MSHQITIRRDGFAEAMFAERPAWHGLGQVLDAPPTSGEAMRQAGLDWEVERHDLARILPVGEHRTPEGGVVTAIEPITSHVATVRGDTGQVLGVVGERYRVVQNAEAFDFLDELVASDEVRYESAGSLDGGRRVWLLARLPESDWIGESDQQLRYVLFSNSHDGRGAINVRATSVRVVCANTLAIALGRETDRQLSIAHVGDLSSKLAAARDALLIATRQFDYMAAEASVMADRRVDIVTAERIVGDLFPYDPELDSSRVVDAQQSRAARVIELFRDPDAPTCDATAWGLLNAVTRWADHERTVRGRDPRARAEARFRSAIEGPGHELKERARARIVEEFELRVQALSRLPELRRTSNN